MVEPLLLQAANSAAAATLAMIRDVVRKEVLQIIKVRSLLLKKDLGDIVPET